MSAAIVHLQSSKLPRPTVILMENWIWQLCFSTSRQGCQGVTDILCSCIHCRGSSLTSTENFYFIHTKHEWYIWRKEFDLFAKETKSIPLGCLPPASGSSDQISALMGAGFPVQWDPMFRGSVQWGPMPLGSVLWGPTSRGPCTVGSMPHG